MVAEVICRWTRKNVTRSFTSRATHRVGPMRSHSTISLYNVLLGQAVKCHWNEGSQHIRQESLLTPEFTTAPSPEMEKSESKDKKGSPNTPSPRRRRKSSLDVRLMTQTLDIDFSADHWLTCPTRGRRASARAPSTILKEKKFRQ